MIAALKQLKLPDTATPPEQIIGFIALWLGILLNPYSSQPCSKVLVNFLEKARYGSRTEAVSARKALATLTRGSQGGRCGFPEALLQRCLARICLRLSELRQAWRASFGEPKSNRREQVRRAIGTEENRFTDAELDRLVKDEFPVLTAATRVAEKVSGIGRDVWKRAAKKSPLLQQYR